MKSTPLNVSLYMVLCRCHIDGVKDRLILHDQRYSHLRSAKIVYENFWAASTYYIHNNNVYVKPATMPELTCITVAIAIFNVQLSMVMTTIIRINKQPNIDHTQN